MRVQHVAMLAANTMMLALALIFWDQWREMSYGIAALTCFCDILYLAGL